MAADVPDEPDPDATWPRPASGTARPSSSWAATPRPRRPSAGPSTTGRGWLTGTPTTPATVPDWPGPPPTSPTSSARTGRPKEAEFDPPFRRRGLPAAPRRIPRGPGPAPRSRRSPDQERRGSSPDRSVRRRRGRSRRGERPLPRPRRLPDRHAGGPRRPSRRLGPFGPRARQPWSRQGGRAGIRRGPDPLRPPRRGIPDNREHPPVAVRGPGQSGYPDWPPGAARARPSRASVRPSRSTGGSRPTTRLRPRTARNSPRP